MKPVLKSSVNIVYYVDKIINCDIGVTWLITRGGGGNLPWVLRVKSRNQVKNRRKTALNQSFTYTPFPKSHPNLLFCPLPLNKPNK